MPLKPLTKTARRGITEEQGQMKKCLTYENNGKISSCSISAEKSLKRGGAAVTPAEERLEMYFTDVAQNRIGSANR